MKIKFQRWLVLTMISGLAFAQAADQANPPKVVPPDNSVGWMDNMFLDVGAGAERQPGEPATGFGGAGVNWGIPLTPSSGPAFGLQAGSSLKFRANDPEFNTTLGGFSRNLPTYQNNQGALAALFDYQHTAFHNDLWDLRPIVGTTISSRDSLGLEGVLGLNTDRNQQMADDLTSFWTHGWSDKLGTEFGLGYQFSHVDKTLFRARAALGLTRSMDMWMGGDFNSLGNYAVGLGVSFHFGRNTLHPNLDNIGGSGSGLFAPFPSRDFPALFRRTNNK